MIFEPAYQYVQQFGSQVVTWSMAHKSTKEVFPPEDMLDNWYDDLHRERVPGDTL